MSRKKPSPTITPQKLLEAVTRLHTDLQRMAALADDTGLAIAAARAPNINVPESTLNELAQAAEVNVDRLAQMLRSHREAVWHAVRALRAQQVKPPKPASESDSTENHTRQEQV